MNDFETSVAEAHTALVEAGYSWAQPRRISETEKLEAARLPHEWFLAPAEKSGSEKRIVRIRSLDKLAIRFASIEMMRNCMKVKVPMHTTRI